LRIIHSAYAFLVFSLCFIIFIPFFLTFIQRKEWHRAALFINRIWARVFFTFSFIPYSIDYREKLKKNKNYVFCPNHLSYLDIPTVGLKSHTFIFVGKNIPRIPIFGYMYNRLHITVDRASLKSKYNTFVRAKEAIDRGISILMFPEGGINSRNPPELAPFKDGPFRLAIEKKVPIVPVTIPFNWQILPDETFLIRRKPIKVIYHVPIETSDLTLADLDSLKEKTFNIIEAEIQKQLDLKDED